MTDSYKASPFHRFFGWRILALLAVLAAYSAWYVGPGFFGQLSRLPGYDNLQSLVFYSGSEAVQTLQSLDADGRKLKYITLLFDFPYMVLHALSMEALIAFGLRHFKPKSAKWNLLFIFPVGFLLMDFFEDSFIALTLASGSEILGSIAGIFTALKFATFLPGSLFAFIGGITGLIFWLKNRKTQ